MSDLNTEIKLSANADGVETGVTRAKRSLTSLRDAAAEAGEQGGKGLDKITAGTDRVPAGAGRAKRSLDDLAKTATQAGEQGSKGMAKFGAGGDEAARKVDAATRSMQNSLQRQIAALEAGGTATRQYQESLAKLRGIDPNAIKPFLDQLDAAKAKADRAGQSVGGLGDASGILRGQLAALAGSLTLGSMAAFVMQINDGVDALNDIKDATGSSIENISALEDVGKRTGASLDLVGSILIKFNDVLSKATPKSDIALQLQAIGLNAEELRRLDPAEALLRTATALQQWADDGKKARLVQDLFGRSVKETAPFLNDLADKGRLVATVTTEQADEAARFNKELFAMQANIQEASRRLTGPLVTSINEVAEAFRKGRAEGKGFFEIANDRYWSNVREFYGMQQPGGGRTSSGVISTAPGAGTAPPADDRPSVVIGPTAAEIAAAKAAAEAAARASAEHRKRELAEQAKFYADMSGLQADFLDKLARAQKERAAGNISEAQYVEYVEQLIQKQPFATALTRDNTEATKAHTTAVQEAHAADLKRAQAQEQTATALADGNRSLRDEIDLIGLSEAAQTRVLQLRNDAIILTKEAELAELQRQSAITGTMTRTEIALEAEIAALKERNALLGYKYDRTALAKAMDAEVQDTLRRADQVGQGLANSLMQGGKSAWEYIKGLFRTELVMRVSGVFSAGASGLFGGPTAMAASTGVSALSTASNAASIYTAGSTLGSVLTTAGQGLSSFTTALTAGAQSLVGLSGTTAQMTASLQAAGYWTGSAASTAATTAGASAGSTLVNAVPYATVALVVANALGLFRKTTTVGSGLTGDLGGEINSYDLRRKSGTLFSGPDYSIRDNGLASQNQALQDAFRAMRTGAIQVADAFDISAEGIEDFTVRIGNELINPDTGGYGLKLEGLNEQQIQEKVQAALATANDAIAAEILGIKTVTADTVKRTVTEIGTTWDDGYQTVTREVEEQVTSTGLAVRRDLLPWMQRIADASGPTAATLQAIAAYPDQLLQLAGTSRDALVQAFGQGLMTGDAQAAGQTVANQLVASIEMSMMGNASAQIFDIINRGIVTPMIDALLTGQSVSAALSQSSLDAVVAKATATAQALGAVLNDPTFAAAMDAIRANVGSALSSAGAAINYTPQYQLQATSVASMATATAGLTSAATDYNNVASEREGLERQLLQLQGNTAALRSLERDALDPSNRALLDRVHALEDEQAAIEKATLATEKLAAAHDAYNASAMSGSVLQGSALTTLKVFAAVSKGLTDAGLGLASAGLLTQQLGNMSVEQIRAQAVAFAGLQSESVQSKTAVLELAGTLIELRTASEQARQAAEDQVLGTWRGIADGLAAAQDKILGGLGGAQQSVVAGLAAAQDALHNALTSSASELRSLADNINQYLGDLATTEMGGGSLFERRAAAEAQYAITQARALAGDKTAQGQLTQDAGALLELTRSSAASEVDYMRTLAQVRIGLKAVAASATAQADQYAPVVDALGPLNAIETAQRDLVRWTSLAAAHGLESADLQARTLRLQSGMATSTDKLLTAQTTIEAWTALAAEAGISAERIAGLQLSELQQARQGAVKAIDLMAAADQLIAGLGIETNIRAPLDTLASQVDLLRAATDGMRVDLSAIFGSSESEADKALADMAAQIELGMTPLASAIGALTSAIGRMGSIMSPVESAILPTPITGPEPPSALSASFVSEMVSAGNAIQLAQAAIAANVSSADLSLMLAGSGVQISADEIKDWAVSQGLPAFANGGQHSGGWALVGEQGPELAYMPPAHIYTAGQTAQMLGGADPALLAEVRALRAEVTLLRTEARANAVALIGPAKEAAQATERTRMLTEKWDAKGMPAVRA